MTASRVSGRMQRFLGHWLAAVLLSAAAVVHAQQPSLLQNFPVMSVTAGMHVVHAEVASTDPQRMQGLMFRKSLGQNDGMLFVFPAAGAQCMWMKNTLIPLSVAFIDQDGVIVSIHEMLPQTENSHCAAKPALFALEMNKGWFKAKGIKVGMKIGGLDKAPDPE